jgi:hypothetical protein
VGDNEQITRSLNPYLSALPPQQMTTLSARAAHAAKRQTRDPLVIAEIARNRRNRNGIGQSFSGVEQGPQYVVMLAGICESRFRAIPLRFRAIPAISSMSV